jgi:catechol 2,3-dioxygenase-like lactoylglutathione lyase family enzyme
MSAFLDIDDGWSGNNVILHKTASGANRKKMGSITPWFSMPQDHTSSMLFIRSMGGASCMFTKISIVSIPVKNQNAAKSFYINVLGCRVVEEMPFRPGAQWIRLEFPGVETRIVLANWFQQMPPGCVQGLVLITDDIAKTCAELKQRGLEISPIKQQPYGQEATFNDPDGNGWVLQQPAPVMKTTRLTS